MKIIYLVFIWTLPQFLWAQQPVLLNSQQGEYRLGKHLLILEDKNKQLTFDDIISSKHDSLYKLNEVEVPNFGLTASAYWIHFELKSELTVHSEWILELGFPPLDHVVFYHSNRTGSFDMHTTGDALPFREREIKHRNYLFPLEIAPGEVISCYFHVNSEGSLQLPLTIYSPQYFALQESQTQFGFGIYYGIILVMILYNSFIFLSLRDENYFYYVLYITNYMLFQLSLNGIAYYYLWPNFPWWSSKSILFFLLVTLGAVLLFTRKFLKTMTEAPILDRLMYYVLLFLIGLLIASFIFNYRFVFKAFQVTVLIAMPLILISSNLRWYQGYRPARYFTIAWFVIIVGAFLIALRNLGILPNNFITNYSIQIGSAMEVILLSLALADRINLIKQEKESAQAIALKALQDANLMREEYSLQLEQEVENRIKELEEKSREIAHINQVIQLVNASLDLEQIIKSIMKTLQEIFFFDQIAILLVKEEEQCLSSIGMFDDEQGQSFTQRLSIPLSESNSIFVQTLNRRRRFYMRKIGSERVEKFSKTDLEWHKKIPIKSGLIYPLVFHNQVIGTISFGNTKDYFNLTNSNLDTIGRYVLQLTAAIHNAQIYEEINRQKKLLEDRNIQIARQSNEITHMNEVARLVNSTLDMKEIIVYITKELQKVFRYDVVGIYLIDGESNQLRSMQYWDKTDRQAPAQLSDYSIPLDEDESIFIKTIKRRRRFYQRKITIEQAERFSPSDKAIHDRNPIVSGLVYPLELQNKVIGTISFGYTKEYLRMTTDELDSLQRYITQITAAIHNAQLYEEIHNQKLLLENTLAVLKTAQTQLVEAEKMASLGGLVAGVAHEINTPLGVALTAASYMENETQNFLGEIKDGTLKRSRLVNYCETSSEGCGLVIKNLRRAAELVQSFKQVAVDQSSEERRVFNVREYVEDVLLNLRPKLKQSNHQIIINCSADLELNSYPGAFSQVLTNLVMNSLLHAYEPNETGTLSFDILRSDKQIRFTYSDDGKGMSAEVLHKAFEPFYTTKRNQGGSGLGLHIVYNIVTQKLKGTISIESEPMKGARFNICIPIS